MSDRSLSRALRWPLWSWRNLALTVAAVLVLGALVGRLTGGSSEPPTGAAVATPSGSAAASGPASGAAASAGVPATPPSTGPASGSTSGPPSGPPSGPVAGSVADEDRGDAAARAAAAERAATFVRAWLRPGTAQQRTQWLRPVAGDRLVAQLAGLPASALAMRPLAPATVVAVDQAEATATVPMSDGRTAVLAMTAEADGWRVAGLSTTPTSPTPATATTATAATPSSGPAASSGAAAG